MQIARVRGPVVSTRKHASYTGKKLLLVQPLGLRRQPQGDPMVAVDLVGAGTGDLVLVSSEGRWARERFGAEAPLRSLVVAVLADVEIDAAASSAPSLS
jgi:ethanolamine utilization protein EutN